MSWKDNKEELAETIQSLLATGLGTRQISEAIGVHQRSVIAYKNGVHLIATPSVQRKLAKLIQKTQVTVAEPTKSAEEGLPAQLQAKQTELGKTHAEMAELLGVTVGTWKAWLAATRTPTRRSNVEAVNQLLEGTSTPKNAPSKKTRQILDIGATFRRQQRQSAVALAVEFAASEAAISKRQLHTALHIFVSLLKDYYSMDEIMEDLSP